MIILYATMHVKPEQEQAFLEACQPVLEQSRLVTGNISYDLMKSTELAYAYKVVGVWDDAEAYKEHHPSEYMNAFIEKASAFMAAPMEKQLFVGELITPQELGLNV